MSRPCPPIRLSVSEKAELERLSLWFSILVRAALKGASFRSVKQLVEAIENFLKTYNETAAPFEWTKIRESKKSPDSKYSNLIN